MVRGRRGWWEPAKLGGLGRAGGGKQTFSSAVLRSWGAGEGEEGEEVAWSLGLAEVMNAIIALGKRLGLRKGDSGQGLWPLLKLKRAGPFHHDPIGKGRVMPLWGHAPLQFLGRMIQEDCRVSVRQIWDTKQVPSQLSLHSKTCV